MTKDGTRDNILGKVDKRYTDKDAVDISHRTGRGKISINNQEINFSVMTRRYYTDGGQLYNVYNFDDIAKQYAKDPKGLQNTKEGKVGLEYQRPKDYEKFLDQKLNGTIELLETETDKEFYKLVLAELKSLFGEYEVLSLGPSNKIY